MITLTNKVVLPDVTKIKLRKPVLDDDNTEVTISCDLVGQGGAVWKTLALVVRNGSCTGVRVNVSPTTYEDLVQGFTTDVPTAFTQLRTVFRSASTVAAQGTAVETLMVSLGLVPAGTVS